MRQAHLHGAAHTMAKLTAMKLFQLTPSERIGFKINQSIKILSLLLLFASFSVAAWSQATVTTDKPDYLPGEYVIITGAGWQPGEIITLHFDEEPKPESCVLSHDLVDTADASGNFINAEFLVKLNHLGVSFTLTATGLSSGLIATTAFTDGDISVQSGIPAAYTISTITGKVYNNINCNNPGNPGQSTVNNVGSAVLLYAGLTNSQSIFITAPNTSSIGTNFAGWYNGNTLLSTSPGFCFTGVNPNRTLTARYECTDAAITTQPIDQSSNLGGSASFSVVATGSGLTYQWQVRLGGTGSYSNLTIAAPYTLSNGGATLNINPVSAAQNSNQYKCIVSACGNSVTSDPGQLTVLSCTPPSVTTNPVNTTVTYGANAVFSVAATGTAPLAYQWQVFSGGVWSNTADADGNPLTFTVVTPSVSQSGTQYRVIVSNGCAPDATSAVGTLTVNKATPIVTVNPYSVTYDAAAHTSTYSITGVNGETGATVGTVNVSATTHTNAGTYTGDAWTFTGTGNYNNTAGTVNNAIAKADALVTVTGYTGTYDGAAHGASGSVVGVAGDPTAVGSSLSLGATYTNVPGGTANWTFSGGTNYLDESGSVAIVINKANATVVVNPYSVTYDAAAHTSTYSITGVNGETGATVGTVDVSATTHTNAGTYNADAWSFTGTGNYNNTAGTVDNAIGKADATVTVTGYTGTYDGAAHGASGSVVGVAGDPTAAGSSLSLGASYTNVPGGTASWTFSGGTNYLDESGSVAIVINKANATVVVNPYSVTYDAASHTSTYSITGVNGETGATVGTVDVSATTHTNAGTYNADAWSFTGTGNYNNTNGTVDNAIGKADATVTVTGYTGTYDGAAHGASGSVVGVAGDPTAAGSSLSLGASYTNVPGGTANWTFTGGTNYLDESGSVAIVINKANATVVVNPYSVTYDAAAHTSTYSITGVNGETGATVGTVDVSATTHTNAGTYNADAWSFTGTGNYNNTAGTVDNAIGKADATVTVTGYTGTYDGAAHGASGSVVGVAGDPTAAGSSLSLGASYTNVPGGTASWTFSGGTNYLDESGSVAIVINKANATVVVNPYSVTYDAAAHTSTYSITGVNGETGATVGTVDVSATTHTNAGTYNADAWSFTGTGNYNNTAGTVDNAIGKADATVTVTGYTGTYDGAAHGASGSVVGVAGDPTAAGSSLSLGASYTNVPGGTASWTFTGGTNYLDESGSVAIVINKANATISVTPYSVTYDAAAHTATGSATGVLSEALAGLDLSGTTHTNAGNYTDSWTFTDVTGNYNDASGTVNDVIAKADALVTVTGYTGTYDGAAHGASGSVVGVAGDPTAVGSSLSLGATYTNVPGGTANWTFTGGTNYLDESGSVAIVINKKPASVTPNNASKYCGQSNPELTGNLSGFIASDNVVATYTRVAGETVGTYTISATLTPAGALGNYDITYNTATFTINGISIDASASSVPVPLGSTATLSATISPAVAGVPVVFTTDNGNGGVVTYPAVLTDASGLATKSVSGLAVEVYKITATAGANCASSIAYLAVYDPNGGFVTGGGWINSPAGAYVANPALVGKANFGFVSKYKKGSTVPEGNTEFQFQTGNLNFSSTSYTNASLVVAGSQAIYKGIGTINGVSGYSFMVSAVDGQVSGGGGVDKFRIKIWNAGGTVYDNQIGDADNATASTALGGGSIVIHEAPGKKAANNLYSYADQLEIKVSNNPSIGAQPFILQFRSSDRSADISLKVLDANGKPVELKRGVRVGQTVEVGRSFVSGLYFVEAVQGDQRVVLKLIKQ